MRKKHLLLSTLLFFISINFIESIFIFISKEFVFQQIKIFSLIICRYAVIVAVTNFAIIVEVQNGGKKKILFPKRTDQKQNKTKQNRYNHTRRLCFPITMKAASKYKDSFPFLTQSLQNASEVLNESLAPIFTCTNSETISCHILMIQTCIF